MPKRKTKSSGGRGIAALMLIAALGVGAFAAYVRFTPAAQHVAPQDQSAQSSDEAPKPRRRVRTTDATEPDVEVTRSAEIPLRIPTVNGDDVTLGREAGPVPDGVKPMVFIANETLKVLNVDRKARSIGVDVQGRNALIDFTPDLEQGFGSTEEGTLIKALQTAMGQFPEIDTFQLVVEGKTLTTLGQLDLTDPILVIRVRSRRSDSSPSEPAPSASTSSESTPSDSPTKPSSDPKAPPEN